MNALYMLSLGCTEHSVHLPINIDVVTNQRDQQPLSYIPQGVYRIGSDSGHPDEKPRHSVSLDGFYIGVYEVSNLQYATFLNERQEEQSIVETWIGLQNKIAKSSVISFTGSRYRTQYGYEDHPVIGISYEGAIQYCEWSNLRLPTEEEWEAAALGGRTSSLYPWGDTNPKGKANYGQIWDSAVNAPPTKNIKSFAANPYGLYNMVGNALEWTKSSYKPYEKTILSEEPRASLEGRMVLRGGGFDSTENELRITFRRNYIKRVRSYYTGGIGFRCATTEKPK